MNYDKEIKSLKLFNEKSIKLDRLKILKNVKKIGFCIATSYKNGRIINKTKRYGPNTKSIDAFVLTIRFFVRDRDGISINEIKKIYSSLPLSKNFQNKLTDIKSTLEQYLCSPFNYTLNKYTFTRNDAFEIIVFGSLAHARSSDKRRQQFEEIEKNTFAHEILYKSFTHTLLFYMKTIKAIRELNKSAIQALQKLTI